MKYRLPNNHLIFVTLLFVILSARSQAQLIPFSYTEDFETGNIPLVYWTHTPSATYTLDSLIISESTASSGTYSLKFDITLNGTADTNHLCYYYWFIPLNPMPNLDDSLYFSMDVKMDSVSSKNVFVGFNIPILPVTSGCRTISNTIPFDTWTSISEPNMCRTTREWTETWLDNTYFAATNSDVGLSADGIIIMMFGAGSRHYTIYMDNIVLSGFIRDTNAFHTNTTNNWNAYLERVSDSVDVIRNNLASLPDTTGLDMCAAYQHIYNKLESDSLSMDSLIAYMDAQVINGQSFSPAPMVQLETLFEEYNQILEFLQPQMMNSGSLNVYNFPATENHRLDGFNTPWEILDTSAVCNFRMCRGEIKPTAFLMVPGCYTDAIQITASDLVSGSDTINGNALDFFVAKLWYQSNLDLLTFDSGLTQELLLKDDSLILVNEGTCINYLRLSDTLTNTTTYTDITTPSNSFPPQHTVFMDSSSLQPFVMDTFRHKLIYMVMHVPENAVTGNYKGRIYFKDKDLNVLKEFILNLEVLPFALDSSRLEYALYYRGALTNDTVYPASSEAKTKKQMKLEMEDMRNHGVYYPTSYQTFDRLGEYLDLRNQVGLPTDKFYSLGFGANQYYLPDLPGYVAKIEMWKDSLAHYGYDSTNLFLYGLDEADSASLLQQLAVWDVAHQTGAHIFAAGGSHTFALVDSALDVFNYMLGPLAPDAEQQVANFHSVGSRIFAYGCPWPWDENPEVYRRTSGCMLWKAGFDGAMEYAYQHGLGNFWNDFDNLQSYALDIAFAYPTSDGIVQTVQWESYREAINDVRYISTLLNIRDSLLDAGNDVTDLNDWINNVDCTRPLEDLRNDIIDKILEINQLISGIAIPEIVENNDNVMIYPNPSNNLIFIKGAEPGAICNIYTIRGEQIKSTVLYQSLQSIDIAGLQAGVYIMQIQSKKNVEVKKFVKL
jgi:hypothetical protein